MHGVAHDLGDGIAAFEIVVLEDKPYLCVAHLIHFSRNVFAVYVDLSLILSIQPADDIEQGRLAAARLSVYGDEAFFGKFKGDALQYLVAVTGVRVEYFTDVFDFYHKHTPLF